MAVEQTSKKKKKKTRHNILNDRVIIKNISDNMLMDSFHRIQQDWFAVWVVLDMWVDLCSLHTECIYGKKKNYYCQYMCSIQHTHKPKHYKPNPRLIMKAIYL